MNFKALFFVLVILFSLGAAFFGVFYFIKNRAYNELKAENDSLRGRTTTQASETTADTTDAAAMSELNAQIKTLTQEKTAAEKAKTEAEAAKTAAETAKATAVNSLAIANSDKAIAQKYNDVLAYIIDIINTHDGMMGITDAEFNAAKALAEQTGDDGLVDKLDWAWTEVALSQFKRLTGVLDYIHDKMAVKLQ